MARNELVMAATPEDVWEVLADPRAYGEWIVGSETIRDWDGDWPAVGSRFHHRIGLRPLTIADHTEVIDAEPPRRLVLRARARPLGSARVELCIAPHPAGALVVMVEDPDGPTRFVFPPPAHLLVRLRNGESLRRLRRLAEGRALSRATRPSAAAAGRTRRAPRPRTRRGAAG
jgi:uncharacterized protein YndB with AHSA1/START domain